MSATSALPAARWRVRDGEEARLTSSEDAEIRSAGPLPLRPRRESVHHARPAFPGTAVILGDETFEVVGATPLPRGAVVYRLRRWPAGEVVRDRVAYGPSLVAAADVERARARLQAATRPWRPLLYPLVGLLPQEEQERACDRLAVDGVTATACSGLAESTAAFLAIVFAARGADTGAAVAMLLGAPLLVFLILPGLGRAASAWLFRETAGSPVVSAALALLRGGALRRPIRLASPPLTRQRFWEELAAGDDVEPLEAGAYLVRGRLPHLSWTTGSNLLLADVYWRVEQRPAARKAGRCVHGYRLDPLAEAPRSAAPPSTAYADEVMGGVRAEWDAFNQGFSALTSMLAADVQERAFAHRGGPGVARRPALATTALEALLGAYLLSFLPGPAADPVAPVAALFGSALLIDAALRAAALSAGRYAPSLLRWLLPSNVLRPERVAYQAHREAERRGDAEDAGPRA